MSDYPSDASLCVARDIASTLRVQASLAEAIARHVDPLFPAEAVRAAADAMAAYVRQEEALR